MPYLRKSVAYDHDFRYTCIKWWYLRRFFSHFFKVLFFWVVIGLKGQKWPKMTKNLVCRTSYLGNYIWYDCHLWYTCVKGWYLQVFFFFIFFSKFLSFCVVRETKEQKIVQNDKKFCMGCLISQEPCIIWSSFILHMCKRIISPGFFLHFLQILIVVVNSGVKGQ